MDNKLWLIILNIFIDIIVLLTIPVYVLYLTFLLTNKSKTDSINSNSFTFIIFANGFWDILNTSVSLFFVELPRYDIWSDFYRTPDPWKARICKSLVIGSQMFQMISACAVAINRWYAMFRPLKYDKKFSTKNVKILYSFFYILTIVYILPILLIAKAKFYEYDDTKTMYYGFDDPLFVLAYGSIYVFVSLITIIIWAIVYGQITIHITNNLKKQIYDNKVKARATKMTAASFIFTVGTMYTFVINFSDDLVWRFSGDRGLFTPDVYFGLTRIGQELANLSPPWIMIFIFPETISSIANQLFNRKIKPFQKIQTTSVFVVSSNKSTNQK